MLLTFGSLLKMVCHKAPTPEGPTIRETNETPHKVKRGPNDT